MSYPVNLLLQGKKVLVAGGGCVALRKIRSLLEADANITVVAPEIHEDILNISQIEIVRRPYESSDINGCFLVIAATDNLQVNQQIANSCKKAGTLFSSVMKEVSSDFYAAAKLNFDDLQLTVSTGGKSPGASRGLKKYLQKRLPTELGAYIQFLEKTREALKKLPNDNKHELMSALSDDEAFNLLESEGFEAATHYMRKKLNI